MPTYVYFCPECELEIEELRPMSMADDPMWCPACGVPVRRGLTAAMFIGSGKSSGDDAMYVSSTLGHASNCYCCAPPRPKKKKVNATGVKRL